MTSKRRATKSVYVGGVKVRDAADVTIQSMTKTDTREVAATVRPIHEPEEVGCEIIRSAVPDMGYCMYCLACGSTSSPRAVVPLTGMVK